MRWVVVPMLFLVAACGDTTSPGSEVTVSGFIVDNGDSVRVCEALAESFPPQCGGASTVIEDLDLTTIDGINTEGGVSWTDYRVEVVGEPADEGAVRYIRHRRSDG